MIHYHGLPITPATAAIEAVAGGHAFVSYAHPGQLGLALDVCQSVALDNGAFSAWSQGKEVKDWTGYYDWVDMLKNHPRFDWAVIPDVICGSEVENDALIDEWPHKDCGVPVWHMHESIERLIRLCGKFNRVALGSSGDFGVVGTQKWWDRMNDALIAICDDNGQPPAKLHGLRMLNPKVFQCLPLSSADSTNIGRNIGIDKAWKGTYLPATKEARARVLRQRIESTISCSHWVHPLFK